MRVLVTGGAGFIGSHLVDALVTRGDEVAVLDDLSTGRRENVHPDARFHLGSIADPAAVATAVTGSEIVFHVGALGAVPRSLRDPLTSDLANVHGTLTVLTAARDAHVRRLVYASSSSVYGGAAVLPTPETAALRPRSPYAVSKLAAEMYCRVFSETFALETVALRYFNVFGPRQRPDATYAAVIPLFTTALLTGARPTIFGDGRQSRDFTFVADVVAANLAAAAASSQVNGQVYNVAPGESHAIRELLTMLGEIIGVTPDPIYEHARPGDVRDSRADASCARRDLQWSARTPLRAGLEKYVEWAAHVSDRAQ